MKFGATTICLAVLPTALTADLAISRQSSLLARLAGAVGIPAFSAGPSGQAADASASRPVAPARSHVLVTPLPKPSATLKLRVGISPEIGSFTIFTDGTVDLATEPALKRFMRCRRTGRELALAPGVLAMLVSVAQQWPGRVIDIVSAFRSPPFGVPHSKHFIGHAIDLRIEGVKTTELRDFVWRTHHEIGVGYYLNENFVHMDLRPGEPDTAWSAGHEGDTPDYNPRWAWSARHASWRKACEDGCT
jgi:uncharacterized protein YcbK (DUF882 family)